MVQQLKETRLLTLSYVYLPHLARGVGDEPWKRSGAGPASFMHLSRG